MTNTELLIHIVYWFVIAVGFMVMLDRQEKKMSKVLIILACVFWPALLAVFGIAMTISIIVDTSMSIATRSKHNRDC